MPPRCSSRRGSFFSPSWRWPAAWKCAGSAARRVAPKPHSLFFMLARCHADKPFSELQRSTFHGAKDRSRNRRANHRLTIMITIPHRSRLILFALLLTAPWPLAALSPCIAQNVRSIAEREIVRRQAGVTRGQAALERGRIAMAANNFSAAHDEFRIAVTFLPDALTSGDQHDEAVAGFCDSGVKLAEPRIAEGKYAEAQ